MLQDMPLPEVQSRVSEILEKSQHQSGDMPSRAERGLRKLPALLAPALDIAPELHTGKPRRRSSLHGMSELIVRRRSLQEPCWSSVNFQLLSECYRCSRGSSQRALPSLEQQMPASCNIAFQFQNKKAKKSHGFYCH